MRGIQTMLKSFVGGFRQHSSAPDPNIQFFDDPTPHIYLTELLPPSVFEHVKFPDMPRTPTGRAGHDYYRGDTAWDAEMAKPGWREMGKKFLNEDFATSIIQIFANDMRRQGCLVNPDKAYFTDYIENWDDGYTQTLSETDDPNALFIRFDFQAMDGTYSKGVHCDKPRRVVGGVLFMSNAAEQGMVGGDFGLFVDKQFANDRIPHQVEVAKKYPFKRNQGVMFLNSNTGSHGPLPIEKMAGMRQWIYYSISSRRDVWPMAGTNCAACG